jgi:hypothetical protein
MHGSTCDKYQAFWKGRFGETDSQKPCSPENTEKLPKTLPANQLDTHL